MSLENNNTQRKKYKQLVFRDRIKIEVLLKEKKWKMSSSQFKYQVGQLNLQFKTTFLQKNLHLDAFRCIIV